MVILTIETCTDISTLGFVRDGAVLAEAAFPSRHTLVKRLIPRLEWLRSEAGLTEEDVQAIAVSQGPGSFTGVRIGLAAAKTLALWRHIPIVGVSTLAALAYPYRHCADTLLAPLMNARRQQVYTALYRSEGGRLQRVTSDLALPADLFHAELHRHSENLDRTVLIGQMEGLSPTFYEGLPDTTCRVPSLVTPHALAALAAERLAQGDADDPMTLAPIYLRSAAD